MQFGELQIGAPLRVRFQPVHDDALGGNYRVLCGRAGCRTYVAHFDARTRHIDWLPGFFRRRDGIWALRRSAQWWVETQRRAGVPWARMSRRFGHGARRSPTDVGQPKRHWVREPKWYGGCRCHLERDLQIGAQPCRFRCPICDRITTAYADDFPPPPDAGR